MIFVLPQCIRVSLFLFLVLLTPLTSRASSIGAGVAWIPYDNRGDFLQDVSQLRRLIVRSEPDDSLFGIPAERYQSLGAKSPFLRQNGPNSFQENLERSVDLLIQHARDEDTDPFLVVAIASHGNEEILALQNELWGVSLSSLIREIFAAADKFRLTKGRPLRIEIIYSACHSGSLITSLQNSLKDRERLGLVTGPVTAITSTSSDRLAYGNLEQGSHFLQTLESLKRHSAQIRTNFNVAPILGPSLVQYGFFQHLDGTDNDFPQFFSTAARWPSRATIKILDWRINSAARDLVFQRKVQMNWSQLIDECQSLEEIWDAFEWEETSAEQYKQKSRTEIFLSHARKEVRIMAALYILKPYKFQSAEKTRFFTDRVRRLETQTRNILNELYEDPKILKQLASSRKYAELLVESQPLTAVGIETIANRIREVRRFYFDAFGERSVTSFSRWTMDYLRELMRIGFGVKKFDQYSSSAWQEQELKVATSRLPKWILINFVAAHFDLRCADFDESMVTQNAMEVLSSEGLGRRRRSRKCGDALIQALPLEELFLHAVQSYDSDQYFTGLDR